MPTHQWSQFRDAYPELAAKVKSLATPVYEHGADGGMNVSEFSELLAVLRGAPAEAIALIGLKHPIDPMQVMLTIFNLGAKMLLKLEGG
jgi:hypothetical protein